MIQIAPSILAADPLHLYDEVRRMQDAGSDLIHVDVMDGHFVPNLSFGPETVRCLHAAFPDVRLDVHLMLSHPLRFLDSFAPSAWSVTVHAEMEDHAETTLRAIREKGVRTGLALKPGTPAEAAEGLFSLTDMVLVMTVEPGFGGQSLHWDMLEKIRKLRAMGFHGLIEADGGITPENLPYLYDAGLDVAVMGTSMYHSTNVLRDVEAMHHLERHKE